MKIYLDIDGVIVNKKHQPLEGLKEFLDFVFDMSNGQVYWLTTHSPDGNVERPVEYLKPLLEPDIVEMLRDVKPTVWNTLKTEGIDLESEFLWFDDNIFLAECKVLEGVGKEYCLVKVEDNLEEIVELLKDEM